MPVRDAVELARGLYFIFFGGVTLVVLAGDLLMAMGARVLSAGVCAGSLMIMLTGLWRLNRVRSLGDAWRRETRRALVMAGLLAYLYPFFLAWRQAPQNLYFCGHGLGFLAMVILTMLEMVWIVLALTQALGRKGLLWQALLCAGAAALLQAAPFARMAWVLVSVARQGDDPLLVLQVFLAQVHPLFVTLGLLPFTLSLSLVWTAKGIVMEQLRSK
jgi:hypothetical protein